jgi:ABC-type branched-subunit amino acid transport system substrate-binding protein
MTQSEFEAPARKGIENVYFEFSEVYKQKFGSAPHNAFARLGFDSVNLLAAAIERAGSAQPDTVRTALANKLRIPKGHFSPSRLAA